MSASWDPVAVSRVLRAVGLDVCPSLYLDHPTRLGADCWEVPVIARMCFEYAGKKEVKWNGKSWEVAKGWIERADAPAETVFDEKLERLAK